MPEAERAAAVTIATLPGSTLWHEGQFEGRQGAAAGLPAPAAGRASRHRARRLVPAAAVRRGRATGSGPATWQLLEATGWPDNQSCRNILAWSWSGDGDGPHVVVVNLSGQPAQGRIPFTWPDVPGRDWRLEDLLTGDDFVRDGAELAASGLFVALEPWQCHLLALR